MTRIVLLFCMALLVVRPAIAKAPPTQAKLREIVRRTIDDDPEAVERPTFTIDRYAIYYYFGGFNRPFMEHGEEIKPFEIPTDTQFQVELIRQYPWRPVNRRLWDRQLSAIEQVIAKELKLIKTHQGPQDRLIKTLNEHKEETDRLFFEGVSVMAQRERRLAMPKGAVRFSDGSWGTTHEAYIKGFTVTVKTMPKDGKVFYLTVADYEFANEAGTLAEDTTWYSLTPETRKTMGGNFIFRAKWSGNKVARAAKYRIDTENQVIVLRPDN